MQLRSARERLLQVVSFEVGGLLVVLPLCAVILAVELVDGVAVIVSLFLAALLWSPLLNCIFDVIDYRLTGRVASDRPHLPRLAHAVSHEMSALIATCPLLVWVGGHGWVEAVLVDLVLSAFYAVYAFVFHLVFDRLRPIVPFCSDLSQTARRRHGPLSGQIASQPAKTTRACKRGSDR